MGECHYLYGNVHVSKEMDVVSNLLNLSGIGRDRLCVRWVSAAEGQLFAEYVTAYSELIQQAGPFDPERFKMPLSAIETALSSPRLRWLMGMEVKLTQQGNVYGENLDEEKYHQLLQKISEEEYQGSLILEALKEGPQTVRELAFKTGLPVHTVSLRLGELERHHQAAFQGYDGTTPKFVGVAA